MRRFWGPAVIGVVVLVLATGPAGAACPASGTVPGQEPVITVATPAGTLYIDDRDVLDADDDDQAGGLWLYEEANATAGLQRGGEVWWETSVETPVVPPVMALPPNPLGLPVLPEGLTLCPHGCGGAVTAGWSDPCVDSAEPDRLWF